MPIFLLFFNDSVGSMSSEDDSMKFVVFDNSIIQSGDDEVCHWIYTKRLLFFEQNVFFIVFHGNFSGLPNEILFIASIFIYLFKFM